MATTTPTPTTTRTYELFDVAWSDGARWTGYETEAEAAALVRGARRTGAVVRRTFTVEVAPHLAHLYRPGIGG